LNTGSRLFHEAQATIAKQASPERKSQLDRPFSFDAGNFILIFILKDPLLVGFLDIPPSLLGNTERGVIKHARDIITDATMAEILHEDPAGPIVLCDHTLGTNRSK
jgi:hypothetical protein